MQIFVLLHAMQLVARYANDVVVSLEKLMSALELNLIGCQLSSGGICVCGVCGLLLLGNGNKSGDSRGYSNSNTTLDVLSGYPVLKCHAMYTAKQITHS